MRVVLPRNSVKLCTLAGEANPGTGPETREARLYVHRHRPPRSQQEQGRSGPSVDECVEIDGAMTV
jgi:hypothetical protein